MSEQRQPTYRCESCGESVEASALEHVGVEKPGHARFDGEDVTLCGPVSPEAAREATPPTPTYMACINCGEPNDGGYMADSAHCEGAVGPFCSQCFDFLRECFASAPAPPAGERLDMAKAVEKYAEWCGGVHDDGCPADDTCRCSGKWINDGVTAAVNYLRSAPAGEMVRERIALENISKIAACANGPDDYPGMLRHIKDIAAAALRRSRETPGVGAAREARMTAGFPRR